MPSFKSLEEDPQALQMEHPVAGPSDEVDSSVKVGQGNRVGKRVRAL